METFVRNIGIEEVDLVSSVLTVSFRDDPFFIYAFQTFENYDKYAPWMFKTWVKWGVLYGTVWATTNYESVSIRRFPGSPGYNFMTMLRSGIIFTPWVAGFKITARLNKAVGFVEKMHDILMKNTPHIYCQNIGTKPEFRHQGFGTVLMNHTFSMADQLKLPCYLETTTLKNVKMHQSHGYELIEDHDIGNTGIRVYIMIRHS